jgi:colanic acid biosynthesis glycosyl transferase WcaI
MAHEMSFVISVTLGYLFGPRADCTIVVSPPLFLGIPVALVAKLKNSKSIFHVQDMQPDAAVDLGMLRPGRLTNFFYFVERLTYRLVDRVSTISQGMRQKIVGKGIPAEKVDLLPNWANEDFVRPLDRETDYRNEWGLADKFVVLYAGNMGVKQGLGTLLDVADGLRDFEEIAFVIVGDGGEKQDLSRRAEERGLQNVFFKPLQPIERLAELLATADVSVIPQKSGVKDIVLPSKLPNILLSARPVVVAANEDTELARIVADARCGIRVSPECAEQFTWALVRLKDAPALSQCMGESGRRYAEQRLRSGAVLERFAAAIRSLSAGTPPREPDRGEVPKLADRV